MPPALVPDRLSLPDGGTLAYGVHGSGPPLMLVAGLGGTADSWQPVLEGLAAHFTVVLHDHRGTGASSRCDRPYSVASIATDVLALMDHLGIARAALAGHSTGGAVGQHIAVHAPHRLGRLVLAATWARNCAYMRRLFTLRLLVLGKLGAAAYRELSELVLVPPWWIAAQLETPPVATETALDIEIIRRRIGAVLAHDMQDALHRIAAPTLVITALDDAVVPPAHSAGLARDIAGARLVELPDGGHLIARTRPERYLAELLRFLREPAA
jgi:aminoacrylate hydrolase